MSLYNSIGIYYVNDPLTNLTFTPLSEPDGSIIDDEYEKYDMNQVIGTGEAFMVSVSRPSSCMDDVVASLCPSIDKLEEGYPFVFFARSHLNPQTGTQPDDEQLIPWTLLKFKKSNATDTSGTEGMFGR